MSDTYLRSEYTVGMVYSIYLSVWYYLQWKSREYTIFSSSAPDENPLDAVLRIVAPLDPDCEL